MTTGGAAGRRSRGNARHVYGHARRRRARGRGARARPTARVDPARDRAAVDQLVRDVVADYETRSALGAVAPLADPAAAGRAVVDAVAGLGPLQPYLDDPEIEEIWINAPSQVFVARGGTSELTTTILTAQQVRDLVEQMLRSSGRRLDLSSPFVDACLPGGERLHVVIPDVTRSEWAVNIRKHVVRASHLDDLVRLGALRPRPRRSSTRPCAPG